MEDVKDEATSSEFQVDLWTEELHPTGYLYYVHSKTGEISYKRPLDYAREYHIVLIG